MQAISTGKYGARWNPGHNTPARYVIYLVQALIAIALSWLGVVFTPASFAGVGFLYWAEAFIVLFTLWWGVWGMLGTYIGTVVGAGLFTGLPLKTSLLFAVSDLVAVVVAFMIYRGYSSRHNVSPFGADILGKTRAFWLFVLWIVIITNVIGGVVGIGALLWTGALNASNYLLAFGAWVIGDAVILIIFLPVASKYLTPILARHNLLTEGLFS
jgi:hypothetical protein